MVLSTPLARPLVEEVVRLLARRGAYAIVRLSFAMEQLPFVSMWAEEAPEELLERVAPADEHVWDAIDAWLSIAAPENASDGSELPLSRQTALAKAQTPFRERRLKMEIPWATCRFPTPALAQRAGMSTRAFEDFVYGAVLRDWDEETRRMQPILDRFNAASEVRIVGHETDLRLSLEGREGLIDDGRVNVPGGEVFFSPVEDATEGVITYSEFPAVQEPYLVEGARLVFEGGRVVEASASAGEDELLEALDRDEGARVLGELGIGCNPGIQVHTRETLFDEKIDGTVHLAIGAGIPIVGGKNRSAVHWDMVKDLRQNGQLYCDGELVQENGEWRL
jgi:aminopeptidase